MKVYEVAQAFEAEFASTGAEEPLILGYAAADPITVSMRTVHGNVAFERDFLDAAISTETPLRRGRVEVVPGQYEVTLIVRTVSGIATWVLSRAEVNAFCALMATVVPRGEEADNIEWERLLP